jgi:trehalose/maltose hydrolase-like predicted phosphorylase
MRATNRNLRRLSAVLLGAGLVLAAPLPPPPVRAQAPAGPAGSYLLSATDTGRSYAPTFTGNGYLGVRVPPSGQGYAGGSVPALSEVAGFYARPPGSVQKRANLPTWSGLAFTDGGQDFAPRAGQVSGWRQQLDLHDGSITTTARWTAPNAHVSDLRYVVFTDRALPGVATVRLELTPHWTGTATVTDLIDGTPATETTGLAKGWDPVTHEAWETVRTQGLGVVAGLASRLELGPGAGSPTYTRLGDGIERTVGQRVEFPVTANHAYALTKYVGVSTSHETMEPGSEARVRSGGAAAIGFAALSAENTAAWSRLWSGRVDILGDPTLATQVNAGQFYLWASARAGVDWSISPAGLSANGYNGHIFWDAETWMYPALLAQHPELAASTNNYRYQRLGAAVTHARETGYAGARYPWESALDGTEQTPPPVSVNSEGIFEQHITADVALAHWQYYLATGDRHWLATRGWPVLSQAAAFWTSRVTPGADGRYHLLHVTGPDEENPDVDDEAYTNVAAAGTLRFAGQAARLLGTTAPPAWNAIASGLAPLHDPAADIHPEFAVYQGQLVKQADVTMLQYPWRHPIPAATAQHDLDYYVPRSDQGGPSMTDAISAIDAAALGSPGCSSHVYTQRSIEPFLRDAFQQFSETRTGGAFTFVTGIGGSLQEFLYGYSGLRWNADAVHLDPSLTGLRGIVLHELAWHGHRFTVAIGGDTTRVSVDSGGPLPVEIGGALRMVTLGHPLTVATRRPDRAPTGDLLRCRPARSSSAQPGLGPLAAVDGSPATEWQPTGIAASLTVPLAGEHTIAGATVDWGQAWPPPPAPNVHPPPGPVRILRATDYDLVVSQDGRMWTVVAQVRGRASGTRDELRFAPVPARFVGLRLIGATGQTPPKLRELSVPRGVVSGRAG